MVALLHHYHADTLDGIVDNKYWHWHGIAFIGNMVLYGVGPWQCMVLCALVMVRSLMFPAVGGGVGQRGSGTQLSATLQNHDFSDNKTTFWNTHLGIKLYCCFRAELCCDSSKYCILFYSMQLYSVQCTLPFGTAFVPKKINLRVFDIAKNMKGGGNGE